jgi:hypothetical protein
MGKRKEKDAPVGIPHKEAFTRMNYLYQAASLVASTGVGEDNGKRNEAMANLGAHYARQMKIVGRKLVIRAWVEKPGRTREIWRTLTRLLLI